jgi:hypothetical protein
MIATTAIAAPPRKLALESRIFSVVGSLLARIHRRFIAACSHDEGGKR